MSEASFFTDMLQSITDRGRQLLFSGSRANRAPAELDLQTLCEMLLSSRGEASGMALAAEILDRWAALDEEGIQSFFQMLHEKFGPRQALWKRQSRRINPTRARPRSLRSIKQQSHAVRSFSAG